MAESAVRADEGTRRYEAGIPRRSGSGPAPLGSGQQLFWLLDRANPGLTAYNVPRAFRVRGPLDSAALQLAFQAVLDRHEVLRTIYRQEDDEGVQVVLEEAVVPFEVIDLADFPPGARQREAERLTRERANFHFDLAADVLLRVTLVRLADNDHLLFFLTHHIAFDGWSKSVLFDDLSACYSAFAAGRAPTLPAPPLQFSDYAVWERERLEGEAGAGAMKFWQDTLAAPLPVLALPTDRPRTAVHTFEGGERTLLLPASLVRALQELGQVHGATVYMVLLAAYQTVLHRYSGQDDIIVGSPTAARTNEDSQRLIGYIANAISLRTSFADDPSFGDLLARVADTCLDAYEHADVPFERIALALREGEQLSHAPIFQCVLTMEDTVPADLVLGSTSLEAVEIVGAVTKFDLVLLFGARADGLQLRLGFRTALFDGDRIGRMLGHIQNVLLAAANDASVRVSAISLLGDTERMQLTEGWSALENVPGPETTITAFVERNAARFGERQAVVAENGILSWAELNRRANRIAHWLIGHGVTPGAMVGLCLDRTTDVLAGMLGVFKAGGAYVPLLPDLPAHRIAQQVTEAEVRIVITAQRHLGLLPPGLTLLACDDAASLASQPEMNPSTGTGPDSLAYVLFTSGSTGVPKGVAVSQANLVHYVRAVASQLDLSLDGSGEPRHFGSVSTLGADLGHTAVFPALCSGGILHLLPTAVTTDPERFAEYLARQPLDLLKITPSHLRALIADRNAVLSLPKQWLVFGGEALSWDLATTVRRAGSCRVFNHYGPTETTVGACMHEVVDHELIDHAAATVPLGRPLPGTRCLVLDAHGELVPIGVPGELHIGGGGVTVGYHRRLDLTADRFIPDRYSHDPTARLYRTGDRVQWLATGELEYLGRTDDQVKIRGFRVEPGEVSALLGMHPAVRQAIVLPRADLNGEQRLVAWVAADAGVPSEELADWTAGKLPAYMVPAAWVRLEALPLNANGKIDRKALQEPDETTAGKSAVAARTPTEAALLGIWSEVLKRDVHGVHDDFFVLGGHSLLAIRLLGRISKEFGVRLPLRALFETPTVAALAERLEPMTGVEAELAALFAEVLKKERVGRHDDFFVLGGHSLLAIRLLGKISKQYGQRIPLRVLFEGPTVKQVAEQLERSP